MCQLFNARLRTILLLFLLLIIYTEILLMFVPFKNLYGFRYLRSISTIHSKEGELDKISLSQRMTLYNKRVGSQLSSTAVVSVTTYQPTATTPIDIFYRDYLFRNISRFSLKFNESFYKSISDEQYLAENVSYFKVGNEPRNNLNHSFIIQGGLVCQSEDPFLLVVIPSLASHKEKRDVIRRTWLRGAESNAWPGDDISLKVRHAFILGYRQGFKKEDTKTLNQESLIYNDIVMLDFLDSYRNLTIKILSSFRWAQRFCAGAKYLMKVDEDTFINIPLMLKLLLHVGSSVDTDRFALGYRHPNSLPQVVRAKGDPWEVSEQDYPLPYFPAYFLGHSYVVSRSAVASVLSVSRYLHLIAPEDAFITGIAAKTAGILRLDAPSFSVCCSQPTDCNILWNVKVALTFYFSVQNIEKIWTTIVQKSCANMAKKK